MVVVPPSAISISALRYTGNRPTVASGMGRSLIGQRGPSRGAIVAAGIGLHNRTSSGGSGRRDAPDGLGAARAGRPEEASQPGGLDGDLELLGPVHLHDRDPDPVAPLELVVSVDDDLLEPEGRSLSFGEDDGSGLVAQAAGPAGVHDHRRLAPPMWSV